MDHTHEGWDTPYGAPRPPRDDEDIRIALSDENIDISLMTAHPEFGYWFVAYPQGELVILTAQVQWE